MFVYKFWPNTRIPCTYRVQCLDRVIMDHTPHFLRLTCIFPEWSKLVSQSFFPVCLLILTWGKNINLEKILPKGKWKIVFYFPRILDKIISRIVIPSRRVKVCRENFTEEYKFFSTMLFLKVDVVLFFSIFLRNIITPQ